jgi:hypothetical protein
VIGVANWINLLCCMLGKARDAGRSSICSGPHHLRFGVTPLRRAYSSQQPADPPRPLLPPQLGGTTSGFLELRDVKFGELSSAPVENLRGMGNSRRRFPREVSSEADADLVWRRETSSGALPFLDEMRS